MLAMPEQQIMAVDLEFLVISAEMAVHLLTLAIVVTIIQLQPFQTLLPVQEAFLEAAAEDLDQLVAALIVVDPVHRVLFALFGQEHQDNFHQQTQ